LKVKSIVDALVGVLSLQAHKESMNFDLYEQFVKRRLRRGHEKMRPTTCYIEQMRT
jgi:hypothetical protein